VVTAAGRARLFTAVSILFFQRWCKVIFGMDFEAIAKGFRQLWENEPGTILLLSLGFLVFVFLVVDARRQKRRRRRSLKHKQGP
jgi:hypothetical protein